MAAKGFALRRRFAPTGVAAMTMFDDPTPPPRLRVNPISNWGSTQTQFEGLPKIEFSIFSPFFRVRRVGLRASHMRCVCGPMSRHAHAFSAMEGVGSPIRLTGRPERAPAEAKQIEAREFTHARFTPRGDASGTSLSSKVREFIFREFEEFIFRSLPDRDCRQQKSPGLRAFRRPGRLRAHDRRWVQYAQPASRCQGRNPVRKIKCKAQNGINNRPSSGGLANSLRDATSLPLSAWGTPVAFCSLFLLTPRQMTSIYNVT